MKKWIKLFTVILLAVGFPLLTFPVSAEEARPSKEMLEQQNALSAYNDLYEMMMLNGVPDNYAGEYIDGSYLVILISSDDRTPYRGLSEKHDCIQFKRTKYSYKELQALFDKAVNMFTSSEKGYNLCEEAWINIINNSVDIEINALEYIKLPKEERDKFFIDGVNYKFVHSSYALDSIIIAEKNGARGWNELDGESYYIKSDGTFATSSLTIGGIRYKFDQSGVCQGKYTGYTTSGKGRRYWRDGELLKNKWIRVKGERKYYAGADGYFVTGIGEIQGKKYLFDKNGAFLGEAPAVIEYTAPDRDDEIDCVRLDFREAVSSSYSLAVASCIGLIEQTSDKRVYAFLADEVLCGGEVSAVFTVTVIEGNYGVEDEAGYSSARIYFKENVRYLLPLERIYSPIPEERYSSCGDTLIELNGDLSIASASVQGRTIGEFTDLNAVRAFISSEKLTCGQEPDNDFVRSDDLSEIVKGSDFILEVEFEGIVHDRAENWTMYSCRPTDTVKAAKNNIRTVYVPLPNGSAQLNGRYLLLLNRSKDQSFLYLLSSPNGSVYPADSPEAEEVRRLAAGS